MIRSLKKLSLILLTCFILFGSTGITNNLGNFGAISLNYSSDSIQSINPYISKNNDFNNQTNNTSYSNTINNLQAQKTSSINSVTTQNSFLKHGQGNKTLLKLNENFSFNNTKTNSISFPVNATRGNSTEIIPTFQNYSLYKGNYSISNIKSSNGVQTVEGSSNVTNLLSTNYLAVATSFNVTQSYIKLNSLNYYLTYSKTGVIKYNVYIRSINQTTNMPNGNISFQTQISTQVTNVNGWIPLSITQNTILAKGSYALVLELAGSANLNWPIVNYTTPINNPNNSHLWTKGNNGLWNAPDYSADLPFYFNYTIVDSSSSPITYTNVTYLDLRNDGDLLNLTSKYIINPVNTVNFNLSSLYAISYTIDYNLIFKRNTYINVTTLYNITNSNTLWFANFSLNALNNYPNSMIQRNLTILNIPNWWSYGNTILNGTNQIINPYFNFFQDFSEFTFLLNNSIFSGNFKVEFKDFNYAKSIKLYDASGTVEYTNYTITGNNYFQIIGNMRFNPQNLDGVSVILEDNQLNIVKNFTSSLGYGLYDYYSPLTNLFSIFSNLNNQYQGKYLLTLNWTNSDLTEIGYYQVEINFVILPNFSVQNILSTDSFYVGQYISPKASVSDYFNNTIYSSPLVTFSTDWGLSGILAFNSSTKLFEGTFSTLNASNGYHQVNVTAQKAYFANQTNDFRIFINLYRPTNLSLISKNGLISSNNNIAQLSTKFTLNYNYTNLLNNTIINYPNLTYYLNNKNLNASSNSYGFNATVSSLINLSFDLNPDTTKIRAGFYNLTIVSTKFGFETQQKSFFFTVKGYNLSILLTSNPNFIPGQAYNIKAQVSYATQNVFFLSSKPSTNKISSANPNTKYLANLDINLKVSATFANNTNTTYIILSVTDSNGIANFDLNDSQTKDLISINKLEANFNGDGYINAYSYPKLVTITSTSLTSSNTSDSFGFGTLLMYLAIILSVIFIGAGGFYIYTSYLKKTSEQEKEFDEKIEALTSFLGMYITNKDGLPIFLKSNQQLEDQNKHLMLSGVTYSIDLFLNNFKDEYMRNIIKDDNISRTSNSGLVNMTVIDQDKFKIIIGVSDSYRMYVLAREANNHTIKIFQRTLENIEKSLHFTNKIINLKQIYPLFTGEIQKVFPIELVNEFEIKFPELVEVITNPEKQYALSSSTITKLKEFSFYLIKNSNLSSITLDEDFDFRSIINNSRKIKVDTLTLTKLMDILDKIHVSKRDLYEILFICSQSRFSIFKNITPLTLPDDPSSEK